MDSPTPGQIAHDAYHAASNLPRAAIRFEDLRASTRRLWEHAAEAARVCAVDPGLHLHDAYFEDTGLPLSHFMRFSELGPGAQSQWNAAGHAVRDLRPVRRTA